LDDFTAMEQLRNGNTDCLKIVMDKYGDRLLRSAHLIVKDYGLAQDVVQETFIQAFYKAYQYKGDAGLYTWLYSILLNFCRQKLRKSWWKIFCSSVPLDENTNPTHTPEYGSSFDIRAALFSLPDTYRKVIVMFYYEGFSIKEICSITGDKEGTVKSRLSRCRNMLKDILGEEDFNE